MSSSQDYAGRLLEAISRTLTPPVVELADKLQDLKNGLESKLPLLEQKLAELRDIEFSSSAAIVAEAIEAADCRRISEVRLLCDFVREIGQKETQEEILTLLLDTAHHFAPRVLLLVLRGEKIMGWSSRGYSEESARNIRLFSLPSSESETLHRVIETNESATLAEFSAEPLLQQCFIDGSESSWHLIPLKALQRSVAILGAEGHNCNLQALSILLGITGLCIENVALKILNEMRTETGPAAPPPEHAQAEAAADSTIEKGPEVEEPQSPPSSAPAQIDDAGVKAAFEAEEPPASEDLPQETRAEMGIAEEIPEVIAAPAPVPVAAKDPSFRSEEEKLHADAKRFARLLVSEIKLYNEQRVIEGRENRDVYVRLKRDIDKSREMYEQRISPIVARRIDYFHDEVIRILGENDPSALGSDYPGPRVES
jgi:hypothetical protein